jgi:flagella basal body P-ring formation protein FlgA
LRQAVQGTSLKDAQGGSATLVEPGKSAALHLSSSGGMQMLLDVMPLDRGTLNQTVRVKLPGTGKILHAQVTGARRLEATF